MCGRGTTLPDAPHQGRLVVLDSAFGFASRSGAGSRPHRGRLVVLDSNPGGSRTQADGVLWLWMQETSIFPGFFAFLGQPMRRKSTLSVVTCSIQLSPLLGGRDSPQQTHPRPIRQPGGAPRAAGETEHDKSL